MWFVVVVVVLCLLLDLRWQAASSTILVFSVDDLCLGGWRDLLRGGYIDGPGELIGE